MQGNPVPLVLGITSCLLPPLLPIIIWRLFAIDDIMIHGNNDRGRNIVILVSVFTSLSILSTAIRILARGFNRQLGWDDLAVGSALIFSVISWPFNILAVNAGYGMHLSSLSKGQHQDVLKWLWIVEFVLYFTLPLTKISICLFILRIKNRGWLKWFLWGMMFGLFITNLVPLIVLCAQCQPVRAYWDRSAGTCWDPNIYNASIWIGVGFGVFSDLACTCLPVIVLWRVQIQRYMKYLISALMSVGLLATSCGAARAYTSKSDQNPDLTYSLAIITEWAILEQHFAILGTNLVLSRYIWQCFRRGLASGRRIDSVETIELRQRRKYTNIEGRGAADDVLDSESIAPLDAAVIRATTDIEISEDHLLQSAPSSRMHHRGFDH